MVWVWMLREVGASWTSAWPKIHPSSISESHLFEVEGDTAVTKAEPETPALVLTGRKQAREAKELFVDFELWIQTLPAPGA